MEDIISFYDIPMESYKLLDCSNLKIKSFTKSITLNDKICSIFMFYLYTKKKNMQYEIIRT